MIFCRSCNDDSLTALINFGHQPRSFDYYEYADIDQFQFTLGQCGSCGVVQLIDVVPPMCMKPAYEWINNKEPEKHLSVISDMLLLESQKRSIRVLFVSRFDDKVHDAVSGESRIESLRIDPKEDLGIQIAVQSQALIQEKFNQTELKIISEKKGKFDFIVCCRMLEHAYEPVELIKGISLLLATDGKLIVEVPDSKKPLEQADIAMLWEEHISYFTKNTLVNCMERNGFVCVETMLCEYPQEDALIGVFVMSDEVDDISVNKSYLGNIISEMDLARRYADKIVYLKSIMTEYLSELIEKFGEIVLFGAGHRGVLFLNLMGISSDFVRYVIDDDPNKRNLRVPGSGVLIKNSDSVCYDEVGVCIFSVSLDAEELIVKKIKALAGKNIEFYSISPDSNYALPIIINEFS
jgi:hypothetical protein